MNWLIIEDALKDRRGHWVEFVKTFKDELEQLGDRVVVLGPCDAKPDVRQELGLNACLPPSQWQSGAMPSSFGKRWRLVSWLVRSFAVIRTHMAHLKRETVVFVPTVGLPHMVLWWLLVKTGQLPCDAKLLLFFMATPVATSAQGDPTPAGLGGRLFFLLLGGMKKACASGRVVCAAETQALCNALERLSMTKFVMLPQPVRAMCEMNKRATDARIVLGSYGPARHEKGSDVLVEAIARYLTTTSRQDVLFAVQWTKDFGLPDGSLATIPESLLTDTRFALIDHLFEPGEYDEWLGKTDVMLLPYRDEYSLRGSRVILEAMIHGIPIVATERTTLADHMQGFGAGITCTSNSPETLARVIDSVISKLPALAEQARSKACAARAEFSVSTFRERLMDSLSA